MTDCGACKHLVHTEADPCECACHEIDESLRRSRDECAETVALMRVRNGNRRSHWQPIEWIDFAGDHRLSAVTSPDFLAAWVLSAGRCWTADDSTGEIPTWSWIIPRTSQPVGWRRCVGP